MLHQTNLESKAPQEFVSIIIPFKKFNHYVSECLNKICALNYQAYEVILLPDEPMERTAVLSEKHDMQLSIISTGSVPPGIKRNIGVSHAKGNIIAFIDDDAYPDQNWLSNAVKHFHDADVAAVGGPNLTPPSDGVRQTASGIILQSWIGGGKFSHRYKSGSPCEDDDLPTVNLLIRRDVLNKLGGFEVKYYPGDDTYLCLQIKKQLRKKMLYSPDVVVYHHRRPLFLPHLRQIWNYGKHRGYFAKKFPQTSRKISFFIPSLLLISLLLSPILLLLPAALGQLYIAMLLIYLILAVMTAINAKSPKLSVLVFLGVPSTHLCYGAGFLKGLLSKELAR